MVLVVAGLAYGALKFIASLNSVSTDDAYVNGHVTFVAPRVAGQVARVRVDDNNRVHKGDVIVELDRKPYQVLVDVAQAALTAANADLVAAKAQVRAVQGQVRSLRFGLQHAIEDVDNQVAVLRAKVATLEAKRATLTKAQADYNRYKPLATTGSASKQEFDLATEALSVAQANVQEALEAVYQIRVGLGLEAKPKSGDLTETPPNLDQEFSTVREAQMKLMQAAAQLGISQSFQNSPKQMIDQFFKSFGTEDIDVIYAELLKKAPAVKQAESKVEQAQKQLDQAALNLSYCTVYAEIDGVVTRRNVNPGNNVVAGQSLMAIRSLTEIWVDANFKETQLSELRIGQPADLDVDMYGSKVRFKGRISGFTMGTGSTLALLPAENATGNFVKVVQRLPVRIEILDYDPDKQPLFIGLSVEPTVHIKEKPTGPDAGKFLQPHMNPLQDSKGTEP